MLVIVWMACSQIALCGLPQIHTVLVKSETEGSDVIFLMAKCTKLCGMKKITLNWTYNAFGALMF